MQKPTYLALGVIATLGAMWAATACQCEAASKSVRPGFALAIHGGAGTLSPGEMTAEKAREYHVKLKEALEAGRTVLAGGGKSLDAVIAAITVLEDSPLFNAGKGAVFTSRGTNELDASIMDGKDRNAGAVAGITTVKNPILLAREVMDASPHVMLQGRGAEVFARERGVEIVEPSYFFTERRWQQLKDAGSNQDNKHRPDPHPGDEANGGPERERSGTMMRVDAAHALGTVGAVALDRHGNLAAGTSTGGMTNKRWGRVGDSPIIGAGTYADNRSCAVSGTGHGEFFIRATVARDICALVEYRNLAVKDAASKVVMETLVEMGARGGIIAVDGNGELALVFNTSGMFRGYILDSEEPVTAIFAQ